MNPSLYLVQYLDSLDDATIFILARNYFCGSDHSISLKKFIKRTGFSTRSHFYQIISDELHSRLSYTTNLFITDLSQRISCYHSNR
jgi:hypothetical protein